MKRFLLALGLILGGGALHADLNDADVVAVGNFLRLDLAVAEPESQQSPSPREFFVSLAGEDDAVSAADSKNAKEYYSATLPVGEYRQIWIINEVPRFGVVVRKGFLGSQGKVYWCDDLQSLAHFSFRAELGQRGSDRLLSLPVTLVQKIFAQARQGVVPMASVTASEKTDHLENMEVLFKVALFRPGNVHTTPVTRAPSRSK